MSISLEETTSAQRQNFSAPRRRAPPDTHTMYARTPAHPYTGTHEHPRTVTCVNKPRDNAPQRCGLPPPLSSRRDRGRGDSPPWWSKAKALRSVVKEGGKGRRKSEGARRLGGRKYAGSRNPLTLAARDE
eukprot:GHVU01069014.1.p1 GENE.GHVU01069014.1~~GHVU01069014.1.p1  ORF type:complete len:130 (+),score=7.69 GHVU01069014.1:160-549(+)